MGGCRSLSDIEINLVLNNLQDIRIRALFVLGCATGFRISELLSLRIGDIYDYRKENIKSYVKINRCNMKGKVESRELPIHDKVKPYLDQLINPFKDVQYCLMPLFRSLSNNSKFEPLSRVSAHNMLKHAFNSVGLDGTIATHSMRKSFAARFYEYSGKDLVLLQTALGHSSIMTTIEYLQSNTVLVNDIIKKM